MVKSGVDRTSCGERKSWTSAWSTGTRRHADEGKPRHELHATSARYVVFKLPDAIHWWLAPTKIQRTAACTTEFVSATGLTRFPDVSNHSVKNTAQWIRTVKSGTLCY